MTLPREEVVDGLDEELTAFVTLLRSLAPEEWTAPTRCEGWTVADVAAHVTGQLSDIVHGRFDRLRAPGAIDDQVAERRGRSVTEVADELAEAAKLGRDLLASFDDTAWSGPSPVAGRTVGHGVEGIAADAWVHADDIRAAIGRSADRSNRMRIALVHYVAVLEEQGWGPATLQLDGIERIDVAGGHEGRVVTGDPVAFVLAATGRLDPATLGLDESINVYG